VSGRLHIRGKELPIPTGLGGPVRYGEVKILDSTGTRTPTPLVVQPVVSHYIDCATAALGGGNDDDNSGYHENGGSKFLQITTANS
jgi:hypothetical protein